MHIVIINKKIQIFLIYQRTKLGRAQNVFSHSSYVEGLRLTHVIDLNNIYLMICDRSAKHAI